MRGFISRSNTRMNKTRLNELGRVCNTNGVEEECILYIGGKARQEETTMKTKT
jgi:hypothetical protein